MKELLSYPCPPKLSQEELEAGAAKAIQGYVKERQRSLERHEKKYVRHVEAIRRYWGSKRK